MIILQFSDYNMHCIILFKKFEYIIQCDTYIIVLFLLFLKRNSNFLMFLIARRRAASYYWKRQPNITRENVIHHADPGPSW